MSKNISLLLMLLIGITLFYICYTSKGTYDSGDGLQHYFISKFSWKHPGLFLDHWGKPFFILVSSPFSQFGLIGMNVFQIVCALATSYFCYRIAKFLELKYTWLLPVFICFSPIYFAVINSGLTEIFFGCVLMFSIWMMFEKKYYTAALAASLLPFVRVDAFVTVPLIALVLIIRRQLLALPLLAFGYIIYSVVGYFYFNDILWVFHQSQAFFVDGYPGTKGEWLHYLKHYDEILGTSLSILFLTGICWFIYNLFLTQRKGNTTEYLMERYLLIFGPCLAGLLLHTLAHSLPGVHNNLGMMRFMATIVPTASIISLIGLCLIIKSIEKHIIFKNIILITISILVVLSSFTQWYFPFQMDQQEVTLIKTAKWLIKNNIKFSRVCFFHPAFPLYFPIDPFDKKKILPNIDLNEKLPSVSFPDKSILIWDTHFGAILDDSEHAINLEKICNLHLLKVFEPNEEIRLANNHIFEVRLYQVSGK